MLLLNPQGYLLLAGALLADEEVSTLREDWNRATPALDLGLPELTALIQPAFPGQTVVASEPTQGGLANTNIRIWLSESGQPLLLRLFVRSPGEVHKEEALNRHVSAHTPVPRFLYVTADNPITGHPFVIMEWIDGTRLEVAAPRLNTEQARGLGRSIGATLASIHALTFPRTGFFDTNLDIAQPISVGSDGLIGYLHRCLIDGRGEERLGADLTCALRSFVERTGSLLDSWTGKPCLVHGDFGGSNILVRETPRGWAVAAVLDWEFAFSGSPFFDLGNLLRPPLGTLAGFEGAVYDGYVGTGGVLPTGWRQMSRLVDLLAWADFMNRPYVNAAHISDAKTMIARTIAGR
jgi:aminoglycoside phosphotransferase (APT) family kinase protein